MNTRAALFTSLEQLFQNQPPRSILEVGLGAGATTKWLLTQLNGEGRYLGLDLDIQNVNQLQEWAQGRRYTNSKFEACDATEGIPGQGYDLIVSDTTINLMGPRFACFLLLAHAALNKGGRLILREQSHPSGADAPYDEFMRRMWAARALRGDRYVCLSCSDVEQTLKTIGFTKVESEEHTFEDIDLRFQDWFPFSEDEASFTSLRDDVARKGLRHFVIQASKPVVRTD